MESVFSDDVMMGVCILSCRKLSHFRFRILNFSYQWPAVLRDLDTPERATICFDISIICCEINPHINLIGSIEPQ